MIRFISEIQPMCQGIHFMSLGWPEVVVQVIDAIGGSEGNRAAIAGK